MKPTLNSHTHCQAAPTNAKIKAWQKVCLFQRSPKLTDKLADEKEAHHSIILIDGAKLVDLMHQYNVGVQVKTIYEVKELDNDFFEGD